VKFDKTHLDDYFLKNHYVNCQGLVSIMSDWYPRAAIYSSNNI